MGQWTKNIGFCQILSGRNVKSEFYVSLGKLWGEFFCGTINLIYYLRTSSELFLSLCWKLVRRGSHNYNLHVHGKILMESSIFSEKLLFLSSSDHYRCSSAFWQKLRQVCRKCNLRVHRNILRRSLSLENFFVTTFITYWPRIFRPTVSFFDCVVKIAFYLYRKKVWARNNEKLILFYLFGFWAKFFQVFFWKFINGVVKTDFCIPRGTFCGKTFLLKKFIFFVIVAHWKKKDWILSKLFWLEFQICILPVHWNILRRKVFVGIFFFKLWPLDNERTSFLISVETFWDVVFKTAICISIGSFWGKFLFFSGKTLFFFSFRKKYFEG